MDAYGALMILTQGNRITRWGDGVICHSATLSATNPNWTELESKPGPSDEAGDQQPEAWHAVTNAVSGNKH